MTALFHLSGTVNFFSLFPPPIVCLLQTSSTHLLAYLFIYLVTYTLRLCHYFYSPRLQTNKMCTRALFYSFSSSWKRIHLISVPPVFIYLSRGEYGPRPRPACPGSGYAVTPKDVCGNVCFRLPRRARTFRRFQIWGKMVKMVLILAVRTQP